jgi:hypothetical protein
MSNTANGGNGGYAYSGGIGGAGKDATATTTVTGAQSVTSNVYAYGGSGGGNSGGTDGASGNATATSTATSTDADVTSAALAKGGQSHVSDGTASATASGTGVTGTVHAESDAGNASIIGSLVTAASAIADAPVSGASTALTWAAIGNGAVSAPALVADQSVAQITAEPRTADVTAINTANSNISSAFTKNDPTPVYFGIGELGGAYSTNDTGNETETSSVHMTVDLTKAGTLHDLLIGFYSGTALGSYGSDPAFNMSLDVKVNGTDNINNFTTVAAANTFFTNDAVDYGSLVGKTSLQLDISLSITESSAAGAGGGYDFGMLIGDPPPSGGGGSGGGAAAAALANLGQAAASLTSGSAANVGGPNSPHQDNDSQWFTRSA